MASSAVAFETVTRPVSNAETSITYGLREKKEFNRDNLLWGVLMQNKYTLTFSQAANSAAITPADPDWPYSAVGAMKLDSNVFKQISNLDGRQLELVARQRDSGYRDTVTQFSLPGANNKSATVTSTGTIEVYSWLPVSRSDRDLRGMINMQANGLTMTLAEDWRSLTEIAALLNIPSGTTLTKVEGTMVADLEAFTVPGQATSNLASYLAFKHAWYQEEQSIAGVTKFQWELLQQGDILRFAVLMLTADGYRDIGNTLGLSNLTIKYGTGDDPYDLPDDFVRARNMRLHSGALPYVLAAQTSPAEESTKGQGIYWYDGTQGAFDRDAIHTDLYTTKSIKIIGTMSAAAPADSTAILLVERVEPLA